MQPVLIELDREMEEAAASLGAPNHRIFRSIVLPNLTPAIIAGCALAFARAIGEFGSLVLLTGNIPFKTQVASVYIFGRVETNDYSGRRCGLGAAARDLGGDAVRPQPASPLEAQT